MKANARITNSLEGARKPSRKSPASGSHTPYQKKHSARSAVQSTTGMPGSRSTAGAERIYGEWILLCAGLCLSFLLLLTSGDSIRTFSESDGIGALSSSLRTMIEENDSVASFFGLDTKGVLHPVDTDNADTEVNAEPWESPEEEDPVPVFSFTGGMGSDEYIELHNHQNYKISGTVPVYGIVSSRYSFRPNPFFGVYSDEEEYEFHTGIDIAAESGTEILCYLDGTVESCGLSASYGYYLCVDHGDGLKTLYAHASKLLAFEGDKVKQGQPIALVGDTGRATGPHLHFEVYENGQTTDPAKYLRALLEKKKAV